MRLALEQTVGDTGVQAITGIYATSLTPKEIGWLRFLRDISNDSDPQPPLSVCSC